MINPVDLDNDELIATIPQCIDEAVRRQTMLADLIRTLAEATDEPSPEGR